MNPNTHPTFKAVVEFAVEAGAEHVAYAKHYEEEPDPDMCMGLWQSFQEKFPKEGFPGDYDLAVTVFSSTYSHMVRTLAVAV